MEMLIKCYVLLCYVMITGVTGLGVVVMKRKSRITGVTSVNGVMR